MSKKLLGIDLGGTSVKFGILTLDGQVQEKWAIETNILEDGKHIVPDIIASIKHRLDLYGLSKDDFAGIGMGSPGAVDRAQKTVTGAFNLNWADKSEQLLKQSWAFLLPLIMTPMLLLWANAGSVPVTIIQMLFL